MQSYILKLGASIGVYLLALATIFISQRSKRIMLITSVHAHLVAEGILRKTTLARLNSVLGLAESTETLRLPESFSHVIWANRNVLESIDHNCDMRAHSCIPDTDAMAMVDNIIAQVPVWMAYPEVDMRRDLLSMLYSQPIMA
jgi:hypothetical protein